MISDWFLVLIIFIFVSSFLEEGGGLRIHPGLPLPDETVLIVKMSFILLSEGI